jgi:NAD(P)-dependent dehydrogenase (short-subunit alcohol dehydrogenase family)
VRGNTTRPDLVETTIDDTAEMVTARGGKGIAVRTDHTQDQDIAELFERIKHDDGRIDILVNNVWGGYEGYQDHGAHPSFDAVFWEQPLAHWDKMFMAGVRATLATTYHALPSMFPQNNGLIVNTTLEMDPSFYDMALFYRTAKIAVNYMTFGMAHDLRQRRGYAITVLGLAMGWMRTEAVLKNFANGVFPAADLEKTESVEFGGRAILAMASDPQVDKKAGQILRTRDLAREYGFVDIDGRQPT